MLPVYIFGDNNSFWSSVNSKNLTSSKIILFLDYDGTLTPIKPTPNQAFLSNQMKELLENLSERQDFSLVIVSGRGYDDIYKLIQLNKVIYISNHGFEMIENNEHWVHPSIKHISEKLQKVSIELNKKIVLIKGIIIEDKGLTISVHYRNASSSDVPAVKKEIMQIIRQYQSSIKLTEGKKVYELRPNVSWNKGSAVIEWLKRKHLLNETRPLIISIGDDQTDEDMFYALKDIAFTIKVGTSQSTRAAYYIHDHEEVYHLLSELYKIPSLS